MNKQTTSPDTAWEQRTKKNTQMLAAWTSGWVASMAVATFGPLFIWSTNTFLTITAIAINTLIGIGMVFANIQYIKDLDEMQQKIQQEAMGITLGAGLVAGLSYSTLDNTNIISSDAEISTLVIFMALTYLLALLVRRARYQ